MSAEFDLLPPKAVPNFKWPEPGFQARTSTGWRVKDLNAAYGIPTDLPGGGVIGILELGGGWRRADLDRFAEINGLPKIVVQDVVMSGSPGNSPGDDADAEVALDIQVAAAAYFHATGRVPQIRVYWAANTTDAFAAVMKQAAADGCSTLSISWGLAEAGWGAQAASTTEAAAAQATAAGLTIFAASGDNSSSDGSRGANVDAPACLPHVVGCGGTTKLPNSAEKVWGNGTRNGSGTGGGFSRLFSAPTYQSGRVPAGRGRLVPDVAAVADPETGYLIVLNGQEVKIGGTSGVAPYYAGLFAAMGPKLGFVHPKLWATPYAFGDITIGSNGDYTATPGPDPCTGLGVPTSAFGSLFPIAPPPVIPPPPIPPTDLVSITLTQTALAAQLISQGWSVTPPSPDPHKP